MVAVLVVVVPEVVVIARLAATIATAMARTITGA